MESAVVATLLIVGALLMLAEVFLPGMIAGTIGLMCIGAGVVMSFVYFGFSAGMVVALGAIVGLGIGTVLWFKYFPDSRMGRKFTSEGTAGNVDIPDERKALLEQSGVTTSDLRPSGTAKIDGRRVDVVSEGQMIEKDTPIRVVAIEGVRVVVRAEV